MKITISWSHYYFYHTLIEQKRDMLSTDAPKHSRLCTQWYFFEIIRPHMILILNKFRVGVCLLIHLHICTYWYRSYVPFVPDNKFSGPLSKIELELLSKLLKCTDHMTQTNHRSMLIGIWLCIYEILYYFQKDTGHMVKYW